MAKSTPRENGNSPYVRQTCCGGHVGVIVLAMSLYAMHGAASEGGGRQSPGQPAGGNVARKIAEFKERMVGGKGFVVGGLDFNQDGTQLATSGQVAAPEVHIWNWRARDHIARVLPMSSSAGGEQAIRYSGDGWLLAAAHGPSVMAHDYGVVQIWDTHNWAPVHDIAEPHNGGTGGLAFSPDGKLLVRTVKYQWPGIYLAAYRTDTLGAGMGCAGAAHVAR